MKTFAVRLLSALCLASIVSFGSPSIAASDSVVAAYSDAKAVVVGQTLYKEEVLPYAKVALVNAESGEVVSETSSDGEGRFELGAYEAGAYNVVAYAESEREGKLTGGAQIKVEAESTELAIALAPQSEAENLEHTSERGWSCSRVGSAFGYSFWYCVDTCGPFPIDYWMVF